MKKSQKIKQEYICEPCGYFTTIKKDYNKHLNTRKHQNKTSNSNIQQDKNEFICPGCSKTYKSRSSMWYHKKKCIEVKYINNNENNENNKDEPIVIEMNYNKNDETNYNNVNYNNNYNNYNSQYKYNENENNIKTDTENMLQQMMEENKELRSILQEQQKQIGQIIPKIGNTTNKFNLNLFLNEQCKDAISLQEFIQSLHLRPSDLEETGKLGYVDGITKIISRGLENLEITKRPIHCSDLKREVLYVKGNDVWEKDNLEKDKMRKAVEYISRANIKQIPSWVQENPDCQTIGEEKNLEYMNIIEHVLDTEDDDEHSRNVQRIIKNVAKNVVLDKIPDKLIDNENIEYDENNYNDENRIIDDLSCNTLT